MDFRVRANIPLIFMFAAFAQGCSSKAKTVAPKLDHPITLEVSLVVPCEAPNAAPPVHGEGYVGTVCLDRAAFVHETDVRSARLEKDSEKKPIIILTLQDSTAHRMQEITGRHILERVGIVVNGQILAASTIQEPATSIPIQGNLTQSQAERLVQDFNQQAGNH